MQGLTYNHGRIFTFDPQNICNFYVEMLEDGTIVYSQQVARNTLPQPVDESSVPRHTLRDLQEVVESLNNQPATNNILPFVELTKSVGKTIVMWIRLEDMEYSDMAFIWKVDIVDKLHPVAHNFENFGEVPDRGWMLASFNLLSVKCEVHNEGDYVIIVI